MFVELNSAVALIFAIQDPKKSFGCGSNPFEQNLGGSESDATLATRPFRGNERATFSRTQS